MRTTIAFIIIAAFAVTGCQPAEPPAAETTPAMPAQSLGVESTATPNVSETPPHILRALSSPERSEEQRARDVHRKPAEILTLSGIQEGAQIIEIAGFGQYFTAMLAEAVGPSGMIDVYDLPYTEQFAGEASRAFDAAHDNVAYHQENYNDVTFPQNVDAVFNVLYYHDLQPQGIDTAAMNTKLYNALKGGGIYLIIDHKAEDGSAWRDAATIHRMGVETIKEEVMAAGFELALESDLLANPADDRTQMVFAPGTRGTTDQAFFIFRKPN